MLLDRSSSIMTVVDVSVELVFSLSIGKRTQSGISAVKSGGMAIEDEPTPPAVVTCPVCWSTVATLTVVMVTGLVVAMEPSLSSSSSFITAVLIVDELRPPPPTTVVICKVLPVLADMGKQMQSGMFTAALDSKADGQERWPPALVVDFWHPERWSKVKLRQESSSKQQLWQQS